MHLSEAKRLGPLKAPLSSSVKRREQCLALVLLGADVKTEHRNKSEKPLKNTKAHSNGCQALLEAAERLLTVRFKDQVLHFESLKRCAAFTNYLENQILTLVTQSHD